MGFVVSGMHDERVMGKDLRGECSCIGREERMGAAGVFNMMYY